MFESIKNLVKKSTAKELRSRISIGHHGLDHAFGGGIEYGFIYQFKGKDAMNSAIGKRIKGVARKAIVVTKVESLQEIRTLKMRALDEDRPVFVVNDIKNFHFRQLVEYFDVIVDLSEKGNMAIEKNRSGRVGRYKMNGTELIQIGEQNEQRANRRTAH